MKFSTPIKALVFASLVALVVTACESTTTTKDPKASNSTSTGGGSPPITCDPIGNELQPGTAPSARGDMAFAFDANCGRVFLFHGDQAVPIMCSFAASDFLGDAYTYDVASGIWSEIAIADGSPIPLLRARARGAWDEARGRFILFGGRYRDGDVGDYTWLNDVWAFTPSTATWEELSVQDAPGAPSGRMSPTMVADPERDRVLIHAGGTTDFSTFQVDSETWAFDLATNSWSQIGTSAQPTPRIFHSSAFDRQRSRLYVFAGGGQDAFTSTTFFRDLWYLDIASDTWTEVPFDAGFPAGRIKGEMAYDAARDRIVLFGGHDDTMLGNNNELWSFNLESQTWSLDKQGDTFLEPAFGFCDFPADFATVDATSPERRESHLFTISGDLAIMYGGRTDCGLARDSWELDLTSMTWNQIVESFTGMTCRRSGALNCDDPQTRMCI